MGIAALLCVVASSLPAHAQHPPRPAPPPAPVAIPWPFPFPPPPNIKVTLPPFAFPWGMPPPPPQAPPQSAPRQNAPAIPGNAPPANDGWPEGWSRFEDETLVLTNQRRAMGAVCGDRSFGPAAPLAMNAALRQAAREHSRDMGSRNYFDHTSLDGRSPDERMKAAGWSGRASGENIFGGPTTAAAVVDGWMKSPGHCENMMNPGYRVIGVGYAEVPGSQLRHYWTQDFGG